MKQIISFIVIVILCLTANLPALSQKSRSVNVKKSLAPTRTLPAPEGVKLSSAEAVTDGNGVYLSWQAEHETQNLGFFVYRIGAKGAERVSPSMVLGGSLNSSEKTVYGGRYSFFDARGTSADSYYIESLGANGERRSFDRIFPREITDLAAVAGSSSAELANQAAAANQTLEKNEARYPKELLSEVEDNSLAPNIVTQRWVAAQPGVKISVKQEGIYRVSRTELQNAGFNVSATGNLWQLYVDGNEQAIIVGENDSYIEFYGKGMDTPESDTKVYYLIAGAQNGKRIESQALRPIGGSVIGKNYQQAYVNKYRQGYYFANLLNGDAENFMGLAAILGSNTPNPLPTTFTFNLTGIDFSVPKCTIEINIHGITTLPHQVVPTLNGEALDPITGFGWELMPGVYQIPTAYLREGENTLQMQSTGGAGDNTVMESLRFDYARKYEAVQNRLSFYTANYRTSNLSGFTSPNIRVFDLTFPDSPRLLTNLSITDNSGNYSVKLPSHRGRVMFAAEDSAILSASSIVANNPSTLATAAHNGELLIVAYKDWMTQANDWANYRRGQGLTVEVVDIDDVLDEFSYGSVDTSGMTQFFQYAKNNWQTAPNYILLIGDASYDYRNYENRPFQNFVPTKRADTHYEETGSDEALCDFNDDGLAEIAVGRIPARSAANVTQLLNKTMTFEASLANAFSRGALLTSDTPVGYDFEALNQRLAEQLPANMPKTFINRAQTDSRTLLLASLNQGPYLLNYSGHGSVGSWQSNWLTLDDGAILTNAPNYSLYFMLTCLNGYFIRTNFDSLGESMLKAPNGGAAAVWASSGKTTPDVQEIMATRFYGQLNTSNMTRIGDYIKDAKQSITGGRDVRLSWALLGDPTLKIKP